MCPQQVCLNAVLKESDLGGENRTVISGDFQCSSVLPWQNVHISLWETTAEEKSQSRITEHATNSEGWVDKGSSITILLLDKGNFKHYGLIWMTHTTELPKILRVTSPREDWISDSLPTFTLLLSFSNLLPEALPGVYSCVTLFLNSRVDWFIWNGEGSGQTEIKLGRTAKSPWSPPPLFRRNFKQIWHDSVCAWGRWHKNVFLEV